MRAQKQAQPQESSASPLKPSAPAAGTSRDEHPILSLQRTVGNQAVQRRLQIRQPLPATTLARDDPKPATPAKPTTPTDTELCKNPFTIDEKIRCELLKKPPVTDAAATETWKQNLRDLFKSASPAQTAQDLHTRLTAKLDDAFTLYFREQFGLADRTEMLTLLAANFLPAPGTKPKAVTSETIGDKTAAAAGSFPPSIQFGVAMGNDLQGDGVLFNPEFWVVEYIAKFGQQEKVFRSSKSQAAVLPQLHDFIEKNPTWGTADTSVWIRVKVGGHGASAAIEDLWNPGSTQHYAFECYTAATLIQLRGFYLSYTSAASEVTIGRAAFNRDYDAFQLERQPNLPPTSSLNPKLEIKKLSRKYLISETSAFQGELKKGDEVPIQNPYLGSPWGVENSIYLGGDEFFAFPKGKLTVDEYVNWVANIAPSYVTAAAAKELPKDLEARKEYVRKNSYLETCSRPKAQNVDLP